MYPVCCVSWQCGPVVIHVKNTPRCGSRAVCVFSAHSCTTAFLLSGVSRAAGQQMNDSLGHLEVLK